MPFAFFGMLTLGAAATPQIDFSINRCDPPSCVPVLAPPPPLEAWQMPGASSTAGFEWAQGKPMSAVEKQLSAKTFRYSDPAEGETGLVEARNRECSVLFHTTAAGSREPVVIFVSTSSPIGTALTTEQTRRCSESMRSGTPRTPRLHW
jgi:hypothetical protein